MTGSETDDATHSITERAAPEVRVEAGRVRGAWRGDCAVFLGVPYGRPPVGERRFAAPEPADPWDGVRDATRPGATPQRGDTGVTLIPEPSVPGDDILNLNVFTPSPGPEARLPVLVYIHGGGYVSGSPASPWYDGAPFARDGVVTVAISYRIGFDGFGWVSDGTTNRGVRDWLLALEWVQRNIAAFGGDPDRVTIAGQSAGGGAVLTLLGIPAAQPLFRHAWSMSPTAVTISEEAARSVSRAVAAAAGVGAPTAAALAAVPSERLHDLLPNPLGGGLGALGRELDGGIPNIGPSVDGDLIARPTIASLDAGTGRDKPLVVGGLDDEFSMIADDIPRALELVPLPLLLRVLGLRGERRRAYLAANGELRARGARRLLGRFVSDTTLRRDVVRAARARGASTPTWVYAFSWVSPTRHWAMHCLDVPFFFDVLDAPQVDRVAGAHPPAALARAYHGAAVSFIRDGRVGWRPWADGEVARVFDGAGTHDSRRAYAGVTPLV
ncbi:carboxylesterase/lipase family protein [Microbacterium sp. Marseille-Q6965]|uniref:carboxylesterase/lipase family protein n=1 Tax=Microbacterium sp. Marseille-Q6965 TaxID=2965072 RepID=UPI0021B80024|nr:carboxylesterase family protein [Microbacterium sp. Marseille-Q6965]